VGGSLTIVWSIHCKATNRLGGSTDTPPITVTFREKA
jgi:hypothetical protein